MVFDEGALKSVNTADLPDRNGSLFVFSLFAHDDGENILRMLQK